MVAWLAVALGAVGVAIALWTVRVQACALAAGGGAGQRCTSRLAADRGSALVWTVLALAVAAVAVRHAVRELRR